MGEGKVYIVGAGLAGLGAAVALSTRGTKVEVFEAAAQAGGRCRSYFEPALDQIIDNGNHLVLSGNHAVTDYLTAIGSLDRLAGPDTAVFDFVDLAAEEHWQIHPNDGPLPWWILDEARRVPGTQPFEYLGLAKLLRADAKARVQDLIACQGPLWDRLIGPFLLAALNTDPPQASAALARAVIAETLAKGGRAYRPRIASPTLAATFIDPALDFLARQGAQVHLSRRLRGIGLGETRAEALDLADGPIELGPDDVLILAVPPWAAANLLPGIEVPNEFRAIVNGHFAAKPPPGAPLMTGVVSGTAEWIFCFESRISITVSAADWLADRPREELAELFWRDVAAAFELTGDLPAWRIVKEKRATFAATPKQEARRPVAATRWANVLLAGDWTATGLPATIESALRSGRTAADLALRDGLR